MIEIEQPAAMPTSQFALFQYGFRPFFLSAGIFAAAAPLLWLLVWYGWLEFAPATLPSLWHGHEMVYGFAVATVAGFLLTAVPNWTAAEPVRGGRLMLLAGVWLAGRVLAWAPGASMAMPFAVADLAFLPLLVAFVAPSIVARSARRNGMFLVFLTILFVGNVAYHGDALEWDGASATWGVHLAIGILLVMSRASLGHTGRPLQAGRVTVVAYGLVTLGAILRTLAPIFPGDLPLLAAAGISWSAGFGIFVAVYLPVLMRPRPDGRPG